MLRRGGHLVDALIGLLAVSACAPAASPGDDTAGQTPAVSAVDQGISLKAARYEGAPCRDERFPRVSGAWALLCDASGRVATAIRLDGEQRLALALPDAPLAVRGDVIVALGLEGGRWRLPSVEGVRLPFLSPDVVGPPDTDGEHIALAYADHVEAFTLGDAVRQHIEARPLPGEPVALAWPHVWWVERGADGDTDLWTADAAGTRRLVAGGPGDQRLPATDGAVLAWADGGRLRFGSADGQPAYPHDADAGFVSGFSVDAGEACWSDRGAWRRGLLPAIGVRCTDGHGLAAGRHLTRPSRSGRWLAVATEGGDLDVYDVSLVPFVGPL